ncbi:MAG: molecular chaperone HtpG [Eubacteriales bacterium]|nr:molecular chaperone HtpG [Eubacteriales bacterium]
METEKGQIRVDTENLMPIIKKWLYSDRDIFLREIVSNAVDAVSKMKKLYSLGAIDTTDDYRVDVRLDKKNKTITVSDNGIGMTREEVDQYINQVAFSGAVEFVNKYCDKEENDGIIGHFGLGFYSAFMVSECVEIETLSYQEGAQPVHWKSTGGSDYELGTGTRASRGTDVILHIEPDSEDMLDEAEKILAKYCAFLPVPIYFDDGCEECEGHADEDKQINDIHPLWTKAPSECTESEYRAFYHTVFADLNEPLFWIHLNVDYPFNLKGILYFPKIRRDMGVIAGEIKLYNNQVFVADNIKEVIPEYLLLLKGVIDCPDLPLNVSRSFLQNDNFVKKVAAHITKKVADKLMSLFNTAREEYQKYWNDIAPFVKYGAMKDPSFYEKVSPCLMLQTIKDHYLSIDEYLELNKEKYPDTIYYVNDRVQQAQYIEMFNEKDIPAVYLETVIDSAFLQMIEEKRPGVKFARVDAALVDGIKGEGGVVYPQSELSQAEELFRNAAEDRELEVKFESLEDKSVPAMLLTDEMTRRLQDFAKMYGSEAQPWMTAMPVKQTLVVNTASKLVYRLFGLIEKAEDASLYAEQIYHIALLLRGSMTPAQTKRFVQITSELLEK